MVVRFRDTYISRRLVNVELLCLSNFNTTKVTKGTIPKESPTDRIKQIRHFCLMVSDTPHIRCL